MNGILLKEALTIDFYKWFNWKEKTDNMKILYLDATAGIAGDMTVAALLDLGVPLDYLKTELARLELPSDSYTLSEEQVIRGGISGRHFKVNLPAEHEEHGHCHCHGHERHSHHHRRYSDIRKLIASSSLEKPVQDMAQSIFMRLAEAEALAHQVPVEDVCFHEVGAVDSIVDIAGTAIGLDWLGIEKIICSSIPLGGGFVQTAHGRLPVPAPATAELMKGLKVHSDCIHGERVTPTGAAILAAVSDKSDRLPEMTITKIGHGAGSMDFKDCPNILRAFLGEVKQDSSEDTVLELSCNLDDVTPEIIGYTMELLLAAGALDVWHTPIQMKKNRPAMMLTLLCHPEDKEKLAQLIMQQTGSLGIRVRKLKRLLQERRIEEQQTRWGMVRFKVSKYGCKPEYEDCCRIAREHGLVLRDLQRMLLKEYNYD